MKKVHIYDLVISVLLVGYLISLFFVPYPPVVKYAMPLVFVVCAIVRLILYAVQEKK